MCRFAAGNNCVTEIAHRYNANFIQIEHRYFQQSAPQNCWTNLDDPIVHRPSPTRKLLRDNQVLILRGKKTYTVTGQEIK